MASSRFSIKEQKLLLKGMLILSENAEQAGAAIYHYLFEIEPELKTLFKNTDMHTQGQVLLKFLNTMIVSLSSMEELQPDIQALKERHLQYGVSTEHYLIFGEALLLTLSEILREDFTAEMESAWMKVYTLMVISIRTAE